ncbi:MAG: response regulator [Bacteroidales bacterium]|nr:response regulator [Bacteroidales bacterium]
MENYNFNILIVDDTPKNLQVLGSMLIQQNYQIEYAINGKAALEWVNEKPFDLILLDFRMPEMDGFEVCQQIKNNPATKDIPIIFLTAKTDTDSIVQGFDIGAADYILKSLFPEHFVFFQPRDIVSGDFYWVKQIKNLKL